MAYLIGTDEAGYGPNLGPLVISASAWEVPEGTRSAELYDALEGVITSRPARAARQSPGTALQAVAVADSKLLYKSGKGIALLERGLLACLGALGAQPASGRRVWELLAAEATLQRTAIPWYASFDAAIPLANDCGEIQALGRLLGARMAERGIRLVALRSRVIFEEEFNRCVEELGSKGEVLSRATLALAAEMLKDFQLGPIHVVCDKHGGRNRYGSALGLAFPDTLVEVYGEGSEQSVYRFGPSARRIEFRFQTKAESHLPAALASMASKYLRELAMLALNDFWCRRVVDLCPTAGYPVDARRFKDAIAEAQAQLGIADRALWRSR